MLDSILNSLYGENWNLLWVTVSSPVSSYCGKQLSSVPQNQEKKKKTRAKLDSLHADISQLWWQQQQQQQQKQFSCWQVLRLWPFSSIEGSELPPATVPLICHSTTKEKKLAADEQVEFSTILAEKNANTPLRDKLTPDEQNMKFKRVENKAKKQLITYHRDMPFLRNQII